MVIPNIRRKWPWILATFKGNQIRGQQPGVPNKKSQQKTGS